MTCEYTGHDKNVSLGTHPTKTLLLLRGIDIMWNTAGKAHQLPLGFLLSVDCPGELLVLTPDDSFSLCASLADLPYYFLNVDLVHRG